MNINVNLNDNPYVVTADAGAIVKGDNALPNFWEMKGLKVPGTSFMKDLTQRLEQSLKAIFPNVLFIPSEEVSDGFRERIQKTEIPIISLDRVYVSSNDVKAFLDTSRAFPETGDAKPKMILKNWNLDALKSQSVFLFGTNTNSLPDRIANLSRQLEQEEKREIALLDDVLFGGGSALELSQQFAANGITVGKLIVGISIGEGEERLKQNGIEVDAVRRFTKVTDEVCQRDFTLGLPLSGSFMERQSGELEKAPYLMPCGDPIRRASIPEASVKAFSLGCLNMAEMFWTEVEKLNGCKLSIADLPEPIRNLGYPEEYLVKRLKTIQRML